MKHHSDFAASILKDPIHKKFRRSYQQLEKWTREELAGTEKDDLNELDKFEKERKIIISMIVELTGIVRNQCKEKGRILATLFEYVVSVVNRTKKEYDMLSYAQIKNFRESVNELERENEKEKMKMREEMEELKKDKDHRWRNIYMVVKDNRVLRKQNGKLKHLYQQQTFTVKNLELEILEYKRQNQKYKLIFDSLRQNEEQNKSHESGLKGFIANHLMLNQLEKKIHKYPEVARKILKSDLLFLQTQEMNQLENKIRFILESLEENKQIYDDSNHNDFHFDPIKLFYTVSAQTQFHVESVGTNTSHQTVARKIYNNIRVQTKTAQIARLSLEEEVYSWQIFPHIKKNNFSERMSTKVFKKKQLTRSVFLFHCKVYSIKIYGQRDSMTETPNPRGSITQANKILYNYEDQKEEQGVKVFRGKHANIKILKVQNSQKISEKKGKTILKSIFSSANESESISEVLIKEREKRRGEGDKIESLKMSKIEFDFGEDEDHKIKNDQHVFNKLKSLCFEASSKSIMGSQQIRKIELISRNPKAEENKNEKSSKKVKFEGFKREQILKRNRFHKRQATENIEIKKTHKIFRASGLHASSERWGNKIVIPERLRRNDFAESIKFSESSRSLNPIFVGSSEEKFRGSFFLQKLLQRIILHLRYKKKEIIKRPQTLKFFIENCIMNLYGTKIMKEKPLIRLIQNLQQSGTQNRSLVILFDKLMSSQHPQCFLEDMFVLFAKMVEKVESFGFKMSLNEQFGIESDYGGKIIEELLSIYFNKEQILKFIKEHKHSYEALKKVEMFKFFILFVEEIENKSLNSQLMSFLHDILPESAATLNFSEIGEFIKVFQLISSEYYQFHGAIRPYTSKPLSLHRLCLFAFRFGFENLMNIKDFIDNRFEQYFPEQAIEETKQKLKLILNSNPIRGNPCEFEWMKRIFQQQRMKSETNGMKISKYFLKFGRLCTTLGMIERQMPISRSLSHFHETYNQLMKKTVLI